MNNVLCEVTTSDSNSVMQAKVFERSSLRMWPDESLCSIIKLMKRWFPVALIVLLEKWFEMRDANLFARPGRLKPSLRLWIVCETKKVCSARHSKRTRQIEGLLWEILVFSWSKSNRSHRSYTAKNEFGIFAIFASLSLNFDLSRSKFHG